jgi:hypothetical protein
MLKDKSKGHVLANKLTPMRIRLEKFLMDYSDGHLKNKNDHETLKDAIVLIKGTIAQIDEVFEEI